MASLAHKSLLICRARARAFNGLNTHLSSRPIPHASRLLLPIPSIPCSHIHTHTYPPLKSTHSLVSFAAQLRFRNSRLSALPDDASGGPGGPGGSPRWNSGGGGGDGDGAPRGGDKRSLLSWYLALLGTYPVAIKAITSAILTLIGDLICQLVIDRVQSLDLKRTFLFTLLGFVLVGPTLHFWYLYLSKLVTLPGASGALLRLVLDQFLFSPIFIGVFLATLVTLEGRPSEAVPKLKQEWFSAVMANWQLWIPFQFLNFRFVPQQFQVLAANVIALVWNVILSFKAHKEVTQK